MGEMDEGADRAVQSIRGQGPETPVKITMMTQNNDLVFKQRQASSSFTQTQSNPISVESYETPQSFVKDKQITIIDEVSKSFTDFFSPRSGLNQHSNSIMSIVNKLASPSNLPRQTNNNVKIQKP